MADIKPPKPTKPGKPVKPVRKDITPTHVTDRQPLPRPISISNRTNVKPNVPSKTENHGKSSNPFDDDVEHVSGTCAGTGTGVAMTHIPNPVFAGNNNNANMGANPNPPPAPPEVHKTKNINSKKVIHYDYNARASRIYDNVNVAEFWIAVFVVVQVLQCSTLVSVGESVLPRGIYIVLWVLTFLIATCCVVGRLIIKNKPYFRWCEEPKSPEDETERNLSVITVYLFCIAAILEGVFFAIFSAVVAGNDNALPPSGNGYTNRGTLLETMRFASITLLFLHRIIRPANRLDPARTMLEVSGAIYSVITLYCVCLLTSVLLHTHAA